MDNSRIPQFYKLSVKERVEAVHERGWISKEDYDALTNGGHTLSVSSADKMIENVIGVMGLPIGLGLNFLINDKNYIVPLAVEEPSIVAALSSAAKLIRSSGGFTAESTDPILIGQIQIVDVAHPKKAQSAILQRKEEILNLANSLHPNMVARGGGAKDVEVYIHPSSMGHGDMVVVHLLVDTCDAMGANLVNTMCEGVASLIESIANGKVFLRILSNLTDRAVAKARAVIPVEALAGKGFDGEQVRDGIIIATDFACVDPYRAATHNKGIMNGIDAVAIATGNDWRAIEAAAHAYAARGQAYTSLTRWTKNEKGDLVGTIEVPLKVGTVGGPLQSNPSVAVNMRMLGVESATELAEVMAAVGLAQNFSALRALATEGIQQGHMTLHARTVAMAAGATPEIFDTVVERLIDCGTIKVWKAEEIVKAVKKEAQIETPNKKSTPNKSKQTEGFAVGHGKTILLGEHAVVYGRHAIAAPVPLAIQARVKEANDGVQLLIPRWGVEEKLSFDQNKKPHSLDKSLAGILGSLGLKERAMQIEVFPNVPRAMGLGGSAAMAVAIIRALDAHFKLGLSDEKINELAYESEKVAHDTPSGIDNALATFGKLLLYKAGQPPEMTHISIKQSIPMVVGITGVESLTAKMVTGVRQLWEKNKPLYDRIFDEINALTLQGVDAIENYALEELGEMMNVCQGLLNALKVSCWEIEELIQIARDNGALGAKLTGAGGGGSIIALCPDDPKRIVKAMQQAGYQAMEVKVD